MQSAVGPNRHEANVNWNGAVRTLPSIYAVCLPAEEKIEMRGSAVVAGACAVIVLSACGGGGSSSALPQSPGGGSGVTKSQPQPAPTSPTLASCNYILVVPNSGNNTITEYDENGHQIALKQGAFAGVNFPTGVAYDPSNNHLYVTNQFGASSAGGPPGIMEFDESGNAISTPGGFASSTQPTSIAFDPLNSYLFTASVVGPVIAAFTQDGYLAPIPKGAYSTFSDGEANLAFDAANGHLYVTDNNTGSPTTPFLILNYDQNGNELTNGNSSTVFPNLDFPTGIVYDSVNQHLYVANQSNNTINEYDGNGNQIATSGHFPNLNRPYGIAFDPNNQHLYVTNDNNTITVYDQNGNQITTSGNFPNLNAPRYLAVAPAQ